MDLMELLSMLGPQEVEAAQFKQPKQNVQVDPNTAMRFQSNMAMQLLKAQLAAQAAQTKAGPAQGEPMDLGQALNQGQGQPREFLYRGKTPQSGTPYFSDRAPAHASPDEQARYQDFQTQQANRPARPAVSNTQQLQKLMAQLKNVPPAIQAELLRSAMGMADPGLAKQAEARRKEKAIADRQDTRDNKTAARQDKNNTDKDERQAKQIQAIVDKLTTKTLTEKQREGIAADLGKLYAAGVTDRAKLEQAANVMGATIVGMQTGTGVLGSGVGSSFQSPDFQVGAKQSPAVNGQAAAKPAAMPTPPKAGAKLSSEQAQIFVKAAGGDKKRAAEAAKAMGWNITK